MSPKVSLIIPVYNVEKYLEKCLDSAINQTLKEVEIIIVNDGSTDNSLAICKKYADLSSEIKLFSQENCGQGYARNFAIKKAKGAFIFCLDADDWIKTNTLELLYAATIRESSDVVICGWQRIDEDSEQIIATRKDIQQLKKIDKNRINKYIFSAKINLMACACLIKKSIIDDNYITYPNVYHEDLYVMPKVYYYAEKISIIEENLYTWLVRSGSTTNTFTMKHAIGLGGVASDWKTFLTREGVLINYKNEFIEGMIVYLDLYIHRVYKYVAKEDQKYILTYLENILKGIPELKEYKKVLCEKDLKNRQLILNFYENVVLKKSNENIDNIQDFTMHEQVHALGEQLNKIKKSRGYKILCKAYAIQNKLIPLGSKRRDILKTVVGKRKIKNTIVTDSRPKINFISEAKPKYDVLFLPHKDYHVETMALIAEELKTEGITSCVMDLTDYYRDERSREAAKKFKNLHFKDLGLLLDDKIDYQMLVCMNDWDKKVVKPLIEKAKDEGKKTVGIIEGINDFYDADVHWERHAYQTVEYLLMTGEHDRQFFGNKKDKCFVVGIPRLENLMKEEPRFPSRSVAVINLNFSYGVLEDKRDAWLESVLEGCKKADIDYIITQHPADKADLTKYNVSDKNMYDTVREGSIVISRFGSIIIEALAMGKPAIYHNPHGEKVWKFQEPMGAYSTSDDAHSLADAIKYELGLNVDYRKRANEFLNYHCNTHDRKRSSSLSSIAMKNILEL